jgi:hypothetical protein
VYKNKILIIFDNEYERAGQIEKASKSIGITSL